MEAEVSVAETAEERAISRRVGCMFLTTAATLAATVSYNPYVQTLVSVTPMLSGCDAESETEEGAEEGETCSLCFAAGTPVHTNHGDVPIEKVHVGEEVEARDSATGREEYEPVTSLVPGHPDRLVEVRVAGERQPLRASVGHPFWVERDDATAGTWIAAGQLRLGDRLLTMKGEWRAITAITPVTGEVTVYNFTVAKDHDYFVGQTGFLVHNEEGCGCKIALGKRNGLRNWANKIGADHLLNDPNWQSTFLGLIGQGGTTFHVNLSGFIGNTTAEMVENEIKCGSYTGWELEQLQNAGQLPNVNFYPPGGTVPLPNPFVP